MSDAIQLTKNYTTPIENITVESHIGLDTTQGVVMTSHIKTTTLKEPTAVTNKITPTHHIPPVTTSTTQSSPTVFETTKDKDITTTPVIISKNSTSPIEITEANETSKETTLTIEATISTETQPIIEITKLNKLE